MAQGNRNGLHGENEGTFEESFTRLQEVVQKLSEGNLTLQEALSAFEEGMALSDKCTKMLDTAELRLKQVSAQSTRAAAESLGQLESLARRSSVEDEGSDTVSLEFESYESRLVFDVPANSSILPLPSSTGNLAYSPLPSERRSPEQHAKGSSKAGSPPGQAAFNPGDEMQLDPLFDEDD